MQPTEFRRCPQSFGSVHKIARRHGAPIAGGQLWATEGTRDQQRRPGEGDSLSQSLGCVDGEGATCYIGCLNSTTAFSDSTERPLLAGYSRSLDGCYTQDIGHSSTPLYSHSRPVAALRAQEKRTFVRHAPPKRRLTRRWLAVRLS